MKFSVPYRIFGICCLVWMAASSWNLAAATDQTTPERKTKVVKKQGTIGRTIPNFVLPDSAGKKVGLADWNDAKYVVVVFMGTQCPIGNAYVPDLIKLQKQYEKRGVRVVGINPVLFDDTKSIAKHAKEYGITFPVLVDEKQTVADLFGAKRTPEVFILDGRRKVRYRGRIDDRFGYQYKREKARRPDLENSLKELLAGKKVSNPETEPVGCLITRRDRDKKESQITYAKHVSRILQNRCAECHHPGTAAPFSLQNYKDALKHSAMIKEVVVERRMPPWSADPRYGHFSNARRLTQKEIDTLVTWIDNGKPFGDKQDLPKPRKFADGWMIGQPDVVFKMPKTYTVQAKGTVRYQYFVTKTNFKKDVWVQAAEARPGNRAVVHHIIVFYRTPGSKGFRRLPAIVGTAPGEDPVIFPKGMGIRIPAGAELVWQMHYTPTGKVEKDRSEVGLIFCKEPPKRPVHGTMAINFLFRIPPGDANHKVVASKRFNKDVELLSLMPHMHLRGKDFQYKAHYPNGKSEIILNVPAYDFNWQHRYRFAKPFPIPKGTRIECIAHFDNSEDNPANPDPKRTVGWGDQTWNEMMIGFIKYVDAVPKKSANVSKK